MWRFMYRTFPASITFLIGYVIFKFIAFILYILSISLGYDNALIEKYLFYFKYPK